MPHGFSAHHLWFVVQATSPLDLEAPTGPKLRAALFHALGTVCPLGGNSNAPPEHKASCPVCWLLAAEKPGDRDGKDLPRPLTVEPPLGRIQLAADGRFAFGLSLFAQAANLFPFLALGVPAMGRQGVGRRLDKLGGGRGRFRLESAEAINPLTGQRQLLLDAVRGPLFQAPAVPVTTAQVSAWAHARLAAWGAGSGEGALQIEYLTPTRIISRGQLLQEPHLGPLVARLFDRLISLDRHYADGSLLARSDKAHLLAAADQVELVQYSGHWRESHSFSGRQARWTPLSGFAGPATYRGPLASWQALLPLLAWGQSIHVGKSATRGDGWYRLGEGPSGA